MQCPNTLSVDDAYNEILPPIVKRAPSRPLITRRRAPDKPTNPYKLSCSGYVVNVKIVGV